MPTLSYFEPDPAIVKFFVHEYNGKGLNWLSQWLMKSLLSYEEAADLLLEAIEDSLLATLQYLRENDTIVRPADWVIFKEGVIRRLPVVSLKAKSFIAERLLSQVQRQLVTNNVLINDTILSRTKDSYSDCLVVTHKIGVEGFQTGLISL